MKKRLIAASILLALPLAANARDYYIHLGKQDNLALSEQPCRMDKITGPGWKFSEEQFTVYGRIMPANPGCWKRIGDKIYALQEASPLWNLPVYPGSGMYYRLDVKGCGFNIPGVSFAGWRSGRGVLISKLPRNGIGNAFVSDYGPMCWRYHDGWFEEVGPLGVYSVFSVKTSVLP